MAAPVEIEVAHVQQGNVHDGSGERRAPVSALGCDDQAGPSSRASESSRCASASGTYSVGPADTAEHRTCEGLSCEAEANPPPAYQWVQKLGDQYVIRGNSRMLVLDNIIFEVRTMMNKTRREVVMM